MRVSWKLGRVAGIDLFLHPSALLIFLMTAQAMPTPLESMAFAVVLLGSVVLHELGHALMARRYGIRTEDITLYLIGGVARLERMPRSAGPELLVALAGPAVNLGIVAALMAVLALPISLPARFLWNVLAVNAGLALFNLLPIFPMDGGRVLRALLAGWLGRVRATEIAATVGRVAAVIGGVFFLRMGMWQAVLLALFVYMAAGLERAQVLAEERARLGPREPDLAGVPAAPLGFRWANRGDGVWRLVPIMVPGADRGRTWS